MDKGKFVVARGPKVYLAVDDKSNVGVAVPRKIMEHAHNNGIVEVS